MRSARNLSILAILLLAALAFAACAPQTEEPDPAAVEAEAIAALKEAKAELDAKRQELRELRERIASGEVADDAGDASEPTEGEEAAASPEEQLEDLSEEVNRLGEKFNEQLIEFINSQELYEGQEFTENQRIAFNMKADEDILVAQEYIDKAGNYQKALDIYTTALLADPGNEKLMAAKAKTEELRYMTEERFDQVKKNMTQPEVRKLLGTPQTRNVRDYGNGVTAWFYPREESGYAAGIFFRERGGELKVYDMKFEAVTPDEPQEG